jgi:hypothetical protein
MVTQATWLILPREKDLSRLHDPLSRWTKLDLIERHNSPDTWTISGPPSALSMFTRGSGSILQRGTDQITSGRVTQIKRGASIVDGRSVETMHVSFAEDLAALQRVIFPSPSHNLISTVSNFPDSHDLRSGSIEDLILGYIRSHAGDLAQADRRISRFRVPASLGRGGTTQVSGRLDHLGVLVRDLAEAGGLGVTIKHVEDGFGPWLDLVIHEVADVSDDVRFGAAGSTAAGMINEWSYTLDSPTTTRAIVAGGGEQTDRDFLQLDAFSVEGDWGVIVETLIDQRQVDPASADKDAELARAGQEALDEGAERVAVTFEPVLGPDLEYRRDVRMGDIVGYDLPGLDPAKEKIREARTVVTVESGQPTETVKVTVGTLDAMVSRSEQRDIRALRAIDVIKRSQ